jgi:outer membrane murein-binding lipoprotein Lpp
MYIVLIFAHTVGFLLLAGCDKREEPESVSSDTRGTTDDQHLQQTMNADEQESVLTKVPDADESRAPSSVKQTASQSITYDQVLKLWGQGNAEKADSMFWQIEWEKPRLFSESSLTGFMRAALDNNYKSLSEAERARIDEEIMDWIRGHAGFVRHVLIIATKSKNEQQYDWAEKQLNSLAACGRALVLANVPLVIQNSGYSTQRKAVEALIQLYGDTDNQTKLKASREKLAEIIQGQSKLLSL